MVWFKGMLIVVGGIVLLGAIGESDYESIVAGREIIPFWQLALLTMTGLAIMLIGAILPREKGGD